MGEPHGHSSPFASLAHRLAFILSVSEVPYPLLHLLLTFCFLLAAFLVPFVGGFAWLLIGALYWALILSGSKRSRLSGELAIRVHVLVWSVLGLTCLPSCRPGFEGANHTGDCLPLVATCHRYKPQRSEAPEAHHRRAQAGARGAGRRGGSNDCASPARLGPKPGRQNRIAGVDCPGAQGREPRVLGSAESQACVTGT